MSPLGRRLDRTRTKRRPSQHPVDSLVAVATGAASLPPAARGSRASSSTARITSSRRKALESHGANKSSEEDSKEEVEDSRMDDSEEEEAPEAAAAVAASQKNDAAIEQEEEPNGSDFDLDQDSSESLADKQGGSNDEFVPDEEGDDDDGDSDDDADYEEESTAAARASQRRDASRRKKKRSTQATRRRSAARQKNSSDDDEDSDEEEVSPSLARKPSPRRSRSRKRPVRIRKTTRDVLDSSEDDEESGDSDGYPARKRTRKQKPKRPAPRRKHAAPLSSSTSEDSDDYPARKKTRKQQQKRMPPAQKKRASRSTSRRRKSSARTSSRLESLSIADSSSSSSSNDEDSYHRAPTRVTLSTSPRRASAQKALKGISASLKKNNDDDEEENRKSNRRSRKDDEEYEELSSESDDSDDQLGEEEMETEEAGFVGDDDVGTADSSDDNASPPRKQGAKDRRKPPPPPSAALVENVGTPDSSDVSLPNGKAYAKRRPHPLEDSSSSEDDLSRPVQSSSPPKLPPCPSKVDAVTAEELPEKHVCFINGGSDRHCFALETLRKVALTTSHPKYRRDLTDRTKLTFLQPPHFRTAMSDDLLDQIASRFGREALDLHGAYYQRKDDSGYGFPPSPISTSFADQVHNYVRSQMGSQDMYACPLCYSVAHRRFVSPSTRHEDEEEADEDVLADHYCSDFNYDPMTVLGSVDNDAFEIASGFCFTKVARLKEHLREDHNVETRTVQGNDLYERYKVRAPGGLLQQYIQKRNKNQHRLSLQGHLLQYWNQGNNYCFVHLLYQMDRFQECQELVGAKEGNDEDERTKDIVEMAEGYLGKVEEYVESFANLSPKLWKILSGPFLRETKEEKKALNDFIDNKKIEEELDPGTSHRQFDREAVRDEMDEDEAAAEYYKEKARRMKDRGRSDDDSLNDASEEETFESEEEPEGIDRRLEEESSEDEDQWMKNKLDRRRSLASRKQRKVRSAKRKDGDSSDDSELVEDPSPENRKQRPIILLDSDDEVPSSGTKRRRSGLTISLMDNSSDE